MSVEWYAPVVMLVALTLWLRGSVLSAVMALTFFTLFDGGAALNVSGASVQPAYFFLVFLVPHVLLTMFNRTSHVKLGLEGNAYLVFYGVYGAATAFYLPKVFSRSIYLPPMLINKAAIFYTAPLGPSKQNITTAIYLIAAMLISVAASAATKDQRSRRVFVNWAIVISWCHIFFGLLGLGASKFGGAAIIGFFRDAKYAQLTEDSQGLSRVSGIFPEPSAYGGYAFVWLVLMVELWLRGVKSRWTGATALALLAMCLACTSTSSYFGLAVYGAVLIVRWALAPDRRVVGKMALMSLIALTASCAALAAVAFVPEIAHMVGRALTSLTLHKLDTRSGVQRSFWAKAGLSAFVKSYGLGVGAGSFRCSSLPLAILGSTGLVGFTAFTAHVLKMMQPLSLTTYRLRKPEPVAVGVCVAWSACIGLLPAVVSSPSADPPILFSILGGLALGWRSLAEGDGRQVRDVAKRDTHMSATADLVLT